MLQPLVLLFQLLQPLRLAHVHPAELRLPGVERRRADPVLAAQIRRLHPSLVLLQNPDDLLFRVPALLHACPPVQFTRELQFPLIEFSGSRSGPP